MSKPQLAPQPTFTARYGMARAASALDSLLHTLTVRTVGHTSDTLPPQLAALSRCVQEFKTYHGDPAGGPSWLLECTQENATMLAGWADDLRIRGEGSPELIGELLAARAEMKRYLRDTGQSLVRPVAPPAVPVKAVKGKLWDYEGSPKWQPEEIAARERIASGSCVCKPGFRGPRSGSTCPDHAVIALWKNRRNAERAGLTAAESAVQRQAERGRRETIQAKRETRTAERAAFVKAHWGQFPGISLRGIPAFPPDHVVEVWLDVAEPDAAISLAADLASYARRFYSEQGGASYQSQSHLDECQHILKRLRAMNAVRDGGESDNGEFKSAWTFNPATGEQEKVETR